MVDPIQSKSLFLQPDKEMMKGEGARRRRRLSVEEERWGYREGRGGKDGSLARSLSLRLQEGNLRERGERRSVVELEGSLLLLLGSSGSTVASGGAGSTPTARSTPTTGSTLTALAALTAALEATAALAGGAGAATASTAGGAVGASGLSELPVDLELKEEVR